MREREPKVVKTAEGLLGVVWLWAVVTFATNGSVDLFRMKLTDRVNPSPFLIALIPTVIVIAIMIIILRIQNAAGKSLANLQDMSPDVFEDWVGARFRDLGYSVKIAGTQGDHGVDLVAEKPGELAVIQCKNYKSWSVGEPVLRDLFGAMHDFGADRAYLVTTGQVTQAAHKWVQGKPMEIWDGERVARLSKQMAAPRDQVAGALPHPAPQPLERAFPLDQASFDLSPADEGTASMATPTMVKVSKSTCPRCGSELVERRNRTTGESFLACPGFPACRYTQPLS